MDDLHGSGVRYAEQLAAQRDRDRAERLTVRCGGPKLVDVDQPVAPVGAPSMPGGGRGWPTARCGACGSRIIWARTVRDRLMPVDPAGTLDGNVRLVLEHSEVHAYVLGPLEAMAAVNAGEQLRWPHHATCPNWHDHYRNRGAGAQ